MNTVLSIYIGALFFKVTAILLLAVALIVLLRRAEPRWRALVARATLVALPLLIGASILEPRFAVPLLPENPAAISSTTLATPGTTLQQTMPPAQPLPATPAATSMSATLPLFWITIPWAVVALALSLREGLRLRRFDSQHGLENTVLADDLLTSAWDQACVELGVRAPELRISTENASPYLTSGLFTALVIPGTLATSGHPDERLHHVFRHEAAHLLNHDRTWIPLARFLSCLLWFHPLAWWLESLHLRACEESCDAEGARRGGADAYSGALAALALELVPAQQPATAFLRLPSVRDRLRAVQRHARLEPPTRWKLLPLAAAVTLTGLLAGNVGIAKQKASTPAPASEGPTGKIIESITIPRIDLNDTPISDAIAFLRAKSIELDPEKKGVNILFSKDALARADTKITLELTSAPLAEALRYTTELARMTFRVDPSAVYILASEEDASPIDDLVLGADGAVEKVARINFPVLDFHDTPLNDALRFLQQKSVELDSDETEGGTKGVNIIMSTGVDRDAPITLRLTNIPLVEALRYVTELSDTDFRIDRLAVVILPRAAPETKLFTTVYKLAPAAFEEECRRYGKTTAKEVLIAHGLTFSPGTAAIYVPDKSQLILRLDSSQHELVESWVEAAGKPPAP